MTKHNSFYFNVDGEWVHMQADPNMTPETEAALVELVRAVRKHIDTLPVYECPKCGEMSSGKEGKACTKCMIAELWE